MPNTPEPDTDQPISDLPSPAETQEPARPARRRYKSAAAKPDASSEVAEQTAEPADAERPRLRRGGRRTPPPAPVVIEEALGGVLDGLVPVAKAEEPSKLPKGRRRTGGKRASAAAAAASPEPEAPAEPAGAAQPPVVDDQEPQPVEAPPEAAEGVPARRLRRRRVGGRRPGAAREAVAAEAGGETEPAAETEVADSETESAEPGDEAAGESRRSRRSRRGGRRRGVKADASVDADAEPEERASTDEFDLTVPQYVPPAIWRAPRLVPTPEELQLDAVDVRVDARIDPDQCNIMVDGAVFEPQCVFVNTEAASDPQIVESQVRFAAAIGIHLFSAVTYLPLKNAYGERSYTRTDEVIKQILDADPQARILLRLQCVPTNYWARVHPGELARYANGSDGDVSFASAEFWRASVGAIGALIKHLADPSVANGDRVVGLHLDKGEWFHDTQSGYDFSAPNRRAFQQWLHEKYQNVYALRAAWNDGSVDFDGAEIPPWLGSPASGKQPEPAIYSGIKDRRYVDYHAYASDIVADAIVGLADAVKSLSSERLLVGVSYGYTFEFAHRNDSGHQSLHRVLNSKSVDILAGPNSYANRAAGGAGAFCGPVDSVRLHRKLWIVEDDTKTHLAEDETEDTYNPKIGSPLDTVGVHRRNALTAVVHHAGVNWMDLWGRGWLDDEAIWQDIEQFRGQQQVARRLRSLHPDAAAEVAVIVDEASFAYVRGDASGIALQAGLLTKVRDLVYRSGASVGFYLQSDLRIMPNEPKVYIFLNSLRVTTTERHAIRERLQVPGKTLVWLYGPGLFDEKGVSRQEVSEIVGQAVRPQPWNSKVGTLFTEERHPIIERLHGGKRMGSEDILNPSYTSADPLGAILGEYMQTGAPSIVARNMAAGWRSVFVGEPHLTGELLRGIYRYAGVHVFDLQDDIIAAGDGLLVVHAPYTGQRTLHLPGPSAVYSLTDKRLISPQTSTFRYFMRGRSTHFFLYGTLEDLSEAMQISVDDLKASHQAHQQRAEQESAPGDLALEAQVNEISERLEQRAAAAGVDVAPQDVAQIIGGLELPANIEDLPSEDEVLGKLEAPATPEQAAAATPSRRRRWNRRHQRSNRSDNAAPVSIDDLLGDLPQRRQNPPADNP